LPAGPVVPNDLGVAEEPTKPLRILAPDGVDHEVRVDPHRN
jgi:hypothetical protein